MRPGSRVLITGGTGFVGSHVIETLAPQPFLLRALVRKAHDAARLSALGVECIQGDLSDTDVLARAVADVDVVLHLAAVTKARSEAVYQHVNAEGTQALVAAIQATQPRPRRVVYLSSFAAVGPARDGQPVAVDDQPHPLTAYGRSKLAGEDACRALMNETEVVTLRAPVVYGPRDRDFFLLFQLAMRGIFLMPKGTQGVLQLIHVHDLVDAVIRAATLANTAGIYHIAEARPYTWGDIVTGLANALGRRVRTVHVPHWFVRTAAAASEFGATAIGRTTIFNRDKVQELLAPGWLCETAAARQDLRFEARISLPEGLTRTAAWYREQGWL
jgi:nucleoside-diphosphate-sugar epimerase